MCCIVGVSTSPRKDLPTIDTCFMAPIVILLVMNELYSEEEESRFTLDMRPEVIVLLLNKVPILAG